MLWLPALIRVRFGDWLYAYPIMPIFRILAWMKDRKDQYEILLYPVQYAMWKTVDRPTPYIEFKNLHCERVLYCVGYCNFHSRQESPCKFRTDFPIKSLFVAYVLACGC